MLPKIACQSIEKISLAVAPTLATYSPVTLESMRSRHTGQVGSSYISDAASLAAADEEGASDPACVGLEGATIGQGSLFARSG